LDMALSADGQILYVTNSNAAAVTAIDLATNTPRLLPLDRQGSGPFGVASIDQTVYVADLENDEVLALDPQGSIVARIPTPSPRSLAASPDGTRLYATSIGTNRFSIIDPATNRVATTLFLPVGGTFALAPSPDGRKVYITAQNDGQLLVLDTLADTLLTTLAAGINPRAVTFAPNGRLAFVTNTGSDEILVIDTERDIRIERYETGRQPRGIAVTSSPIPGQTVVTDAPRPDQFSLAPVFPNPFNASVRIRYALPEADSMGPVRLTIFNGLGQQVRSLVGQPQGSGSYELVWNGKDDDGQSLASGVYMVRLRAAKRQALRKMVLLR
jgi:YVTN family beta-propeller protein